MIRQHEMGRCTRLLVTTALCLGATCCLQTSATMQRPSDSGAATARAVYGVMTRLTSVHVAQTSLGYRNDIWCTVNTLHHVGRPLSGPGLYVEELDIGQISWRRTAPHGTWSIVHIGVPQASYIVDCLSSPVVRSNPPADVTVQPDPRCPAGACAVLLARIAHAGPFGSTIEAAVQLALGTDRLVGEVDSELHTGTPFFMASYDSYGLVPPATPPPA